ncbi:MAG: histidine--tRNA ligase [Bacilli bacterium]|jgi:histidyl-tRNA synthetase
MKKLIKPRTLSGFMELLPNEQLKFNQLLKGIETTYKKYGFLPLDTPVIEASEVLLAKAGGETEKQLYQFSKGKTALTLRFDLTVPLAKYVAKNYGKLSFPFRRYQIGKVYRGERTQKGRFREFYQCDIDMIGDGELSIINDAEIVKIIDDLFSTLNLPNFIIKINNRKVLTGFFNYLNLEKESIEIMRIIDKLPKIGEKEVKNELKKLKIPLNILNNILSFINISGTNKEILSQLDKLKIKQETFKKGIEELKEVYHYLQLFQINENKIKIDLKISRGLDYYTGTVYETFFLDYPELGSICSGGRYDDLAEYYIEKKLPGVGVSIGLTRLFDQLNKLKLLKEEKVKPIDYLIVPLTKDYQYLINCYNELQKNNIKTQIFYEKRSLKSIINYALHLNIPFLIFIGEEEINTKTITVKDLKTYQQKTIPLKELLKEESYEN